jgi:predicted N-formylglutamate amidohydrolase
VTKRAAGRTRLLLTCEHGGNRIPRGYAALFRGAGGALASHRGWDPGALQVARALAGRLRVPLLAVTWSRLLVESNRAPTNPRIWSRYTAGLSREEKQQILARYWWPHRSAVEASVRDAIAAGGRVLHVAVHSFTPRLGGEVRNADVGLLYGAKRPREARVCRSWQAELHRIDPGLRVRRNYPYRGEADGLPTWLRRRFPDRDYAGFELELNQALMDGRRRGLTRTLAASLEALLDAARARPGARGASGGRLTPLPRPRSFQQRARLAAAPPPARTPPPAPPARTAGPAARTRRAPRARRTGSPGTGCRPNRCG